MAGIIGLYPKCADKDVRGAVEAVAGLAIVAVVIRKAWKPAKALVKVVLKM